jgi:hypothetical protein
MQINHEYDNYDDIPDEEFSEVINQLAFENVQHTLSLPGIYEIISEEYNNEALDLLCPGRDDEEEPTP